jgi:CRISPR/Cas system CSM-associated protein Csm4 (group 5 of RAMP superfamily)
MESELIVKLRQFFKEGSVFNDEDEEIVELKGCVGGAQSTVYEVVRATKSFIFKASEHRIVF